jgi:hypothetical protein
MNKHTHWSFCSTDTDFDGARILHEAPPGTDVIEVARGNERLVFIRTTFYEQAKAIDISPPHHLSYASMVIDRGHLCYSMGSSGDWMSSYEGTTEEWIAWRDAVLARENAAIRTTVRAW